MVMVVVVACCGLQRIDHRPACAADVRVCAGRFCISTLQGRRRYLCSDSTTRKQVRSSPTCGSGDMSRP